MEDALKQYAELKEQAVSIDAAELIEARLAVREKKEHSAVEKVKSAYSEKYDPMLMHDSKRDVANLLHEEAEVRSVGVRSSEAETASTAKAEQKETSRQLGTIKFQRECIWNDVLPFQKAIC